jgi:hypothetical protein
MSHPRGIYQVCQVLAQISGNNYTIIPDVSSVHDSQRELIKKAIADQEQIGWHKAMQGYLRKHWRLAVSAN